MTDKTDTTYKVTAAPQRGWVELSTFFQFGKSDTLYLELEPLRSWLNELFPEACVVTRDTEVENTPYDLDEVSVKQLIQLLNAQSQVLVGSDLSVYPERKGLHPELLFQRVDVSWREEHGARCRNESLCWPSFVMRDDNSDQAVVNLSAVNACGAKDGEAIAPCGFVFLLTFRQNSSARDAAFNHFVRHWADKLAKAYGLKSSEAA